MVVLLLFFYNLFHCMESCGILEPSNELHLFSLHYVFLPRMIRNLQMFQEAYNRAPLSTKWGYSPTQLWIHGMLSMANSQETVALEFIDPEVKWGCLQKVGKPWSIISLCEKFELLGPVFQRLDNAIHRINHYPVDKC